MTQPTAEFFDRYARDFDAIYGTKNSRLNRVVNKVLRRSMRLRYERVVAGCNPIIGHSVLDIGCGPGRYSVELAHRGAGRVLGIDFADSMLEIARKAAVDKRVENICAFRHADFFRDTFDERFDYVVVMGFMDYVEQPEPIVQKAVGLAKSRALFSFPLDGGVLAWQRKLRYKLRCNLFMYSEDQVQRIFSATTVARVDVSKIDRDLFVTAYID
jgi:2-polyprenyl-3-methyl-5-hydroxy-6-metoxy-1,4-benzoquinol methylase